MGVAMAAATYPSLYSERVPPAKVQPSAVSLPMQSALHSSLDGLERLMKVRLEDDIRRLHVIRSRKMADDYKREILPYYWGYCSAVVSRGVYRHDSILNYVAVWCVDCGEYSKGLFVAEHALQSFYERGRLRHTPGLRGFKRNLAETLVESIADAALKHPHLAEMRSSLVHVYDITRLHDMNDPISFKLHKALALCLQDSDPHQALFHCQEAYVLRPLKQLAKIQQYLEQRIGKANEPKN